jgi:hypothetical protein
MVIGWKSEEWWGEKNYGWTNVGAGSSVFFLLRSSLTGRVKLRKEKEKEGNLSQAQTSTDRVY